MSAPQLTPNRRYRPPRLLVPWESRRSSLRAEIAAALARSRPPLEIEEHNSGVPAREIAVSTVLHGAALALLLAVLPLFQYSAPVRPKPLDKYDDIVYYPSESLPQMEDAGGAQRGRSGSSGGHEAYHPTQTIRISRSNIIAPVIVDAPKLQLPSSTGAVANIVALARAPLPTAPVSAATASAPALRSLPTDVAAPTPPPGTGAPETTLTAVEPPPSDVVLPAAQPAALVPDPKLVLPPPPAVTAANSVPKLQGIAGDPYSVVPPTEVKAPPATPSGAASAGPAGAPSGKDESGLVISINAGDKVGIPEKSSTGSLAMSPSGSGGPGAGGTGGGTGIGKGTGPGSGSSGSGPGSGANGPGFGNDKYARNGISPGPGPGGSGAGSHPGTGLAGVTIRGGTVNLPSFASSAPQALGGAVRPLGPRRAPAITIIATPRAGGALNAYGVLKGSRVYTIYVDTQGGTAVLQYAAHSHAGEYDGDLTAPEPIATDFPSTGRAVHAVVSCLMDTTGHLVNIKVMESASAELSASIVDALKQWRFRPVLQDGQPVSVDALLGFGVTTR